MGAGDETAAHPQGHLDMCPVTTLLGHGWRWGWDCCIVCCTSRKSPEVSLGEVGKWGPLTGVQASQPVWVGFSSMARSSCVPEATPHEYGGVALGGQQGTPPSMCRMHKRPPREPSRHQGHTWPPQVPGPRLEGVLAVREGGLQGDARGMGRCRGQRGPPEQPDSWCLWSKDIREKVRAQA